MFRGRLGAVFFRIGVLWLLLFGVFEMVSKGIEESLLFLCMDTANTTTTTITSTGWDWAMREHRESKAFFFFFVFLLFSSKSF